MSRLYTVILLLFSINLYSQTPNWVWAKKAVGTYTDHGVAIANDAAGNIYATGWFASPFIIFGQDTLFNSQPNTTDIFLVKYNSDGDVLWARNPYGNEHEFAYS